MLRLPLRSHLAALAVQRLHALPDELVGAKVQHARREEALLVCPGAGEQRERVELVERVRARGEIRVDGGEAQGETEVLAELGGGGEEDVCCWVLGGVSKSFRGFWNQKGRSWFPLPLGRRLRSIRLACCGRCRC